MSLLENILNWTEKLPNWQRDAARRLFQQDGSLSEKDVNEIYFLLKKEHGVLVGNCVEAVPISKKHMPTTPGSDRQILLTSIHHLSNVNRLPSDQVLKFEPSGLTIIYGGNGSGKSGYARVLKRACRARDVENVLPDMNFADAVQNIPTASFDILENNVSRTLTWKHNDHSTPEELSTIAVFDSHCARVYLTEENDVAYLPYGLDVLESLANDLLPELGKRLENEVAGIRIEKTHLGQWDETTKAGSAIATLSASTELSSLQALSSLTEQEDNRIIEIEEVLRQPDPLVKANEYKIVYQQLKELAEKISKIHFCLNDNVIAKIKQLHQNVQNSEAAVQIVAERLQSNETLLPGTGNAAWRELFEAARRFCIQGHGSDEAFPPADRLSPCPLCQNPLNEAVSRLKRFDEFIKADSSQKLNQAKQRLGNEINSVRSLTVNIEIGKNLKDIITKVSPDIVADISHFEAMLADKKEAILAVFDSQTWPEIISTDDSVYKKIRKLAANYCREMRSLFKVSDPVKSTQIKSELKELQSRKQLSRCFEQVKDLLQRMKIREMLLQCKKSLVTTGISKKSKELASEFVTEDLKNAMLREFQNFGIDYVKAKVSDKSVKGVTKHRLLLDFPTKVKLEQILSEGEQRALALSAFLAELNLSQYKGGIVFDDPVSSLDHWRRKKVAERLVDEARIRQVIVFTHDTVFLNELMESSRNTIAVTVNHLEWNSNIPGYVSDGLPWEHKSVEDRIDKLEKAQKLLASSWQPYPNEEQQSSIRSLYSKLRATVERVVEKNIFCEVVCRYRDWVNISLLSDVVGFDQSECDQINALHKKCCDMTDAHDTSSNRLQAVPSPQELEQDILTLGNLIRSIKGRKKAIQAARGAR